MDITEHAILIAFALGLLGFIEPCTIGAHLLFLDGQKTRTAKQRLAATGAFMGARVLVMAGFGVTIVPLGQSLINFQTSAWMLFGIIYLGLGLLIMSGMARLLRHRIHFLPDHWRKTTNPALQGLFFGFNIPACSAPILFALLGAAATLNSMMTGFLMMTVFAIGLSAPLFPISVIPAAARQLDRFAGWLRCRRWLLGLVFAGLGVWSIWFGLYVDPVNWSQL